MLIREKGNKYTEKGNTLKGRKKPNEPKGRISFFIQQFDFHINYNVKTTFMYIIVTLKSSLYSHSGVFLAVSSNTRYQIVNALEQIVEASPLGKKIPPVAMAFTVGVRFANNIYGGMQFVDWARWSGVQ